MSVSCTYRLLFCEFHDSRDHFSRFSLKYQLERIFETASRYSDVTGPSINAVLQPVGVFLAGSGCSLRDLVFYHTGRGRRIFRKDPRPRRTDSLCRADFGTAPRDFTKNQLFLFSKTTVFKFLWFFTQFLQKSC